LVRKKKVIDTEAVVARKKKRGEGLDDKGGRDGREGPGEKSKRTVKNRASNSNRSIRKWKEGEGEGGMLNGHQYNGRKNT